MSYVYKTTRSELFYLNASTGAPDTVKPYGDGWELCGQCAVPRGDDFGIIFWTWRRPLPPTPTDY